MSPMTSSATLVRCPVRIQFFATVRPVQGSAGVTCPFCVRWILRRLIMPTRERKGERQERLLVRSGLCWTDVSIRLSGLHCPPIGCSSLGIHAASTDCLLTSFLCPSCEEDWWRHSEEEIPPVSESILLLGCDRSPSTRELCLFCLLESCLACV